MLSLVQLNYASLLLFSVRILEMKPATNAFLRTTTAVTQFNAGVKVCTTNTTSNTRNRVVPHLQTPRRELKIRRVT